MESIYIEVIGLVLVILSSVYLIPQILKTYKSKKTRDLSQLFLVYTFVVHALWTAYNTYRVFQDVTLYPYLVNSSIRTLSAGVLLALFYAYRKKEERKQ